MSNLEFAPPPEPPFPPSAWFAAPPPPPTEVIESKTELVPLGDTLFGSPGTQALEAPPPPTVTV